MQAHTAETTGWVGGGAGPPASPHLCASSRPLSPSTRSSARAGLDSHCLSCDSGLPPYHRSRRSDPYWPLAVGNTPQAKPFHLPFRLLIRSAMPIKLIIDTDPGVGERSERRSCKRAGAGGARYSAVPVCRELVHIKSHVWNCAMQRDRELGSQHCPPPPLPLPGPCTPPPHIPPAQMTQWPYWRPSTRQRLRSWG